VTTEPADASTEPSKYSPGLLRLIKIARVTRDLLIMVGGLALIVIGFVHVPHTLAYNYAWIFGLILFLAFGIAALFHTFPFDRDWNRWVRFLWSLAGIGLGGVVVVIALGSSGFLGQRADATLTDCGPTTLYHHISGSHTGIVGLLSGDDTFTTTATECDGPIRWPDGSRETVGVVGVRPGAVVNFVKPGMTTSWAVDEGPTYPWPDALSLGFVGALMFLQGVYSVVVVIVGGLLALLWPRRSDTNLPPGRLPV
jgi:hypothetical protein